MAFSFAVFGCRLIDDGAVCRGVRTHHAHARMEVDCTGQHCLRFIVRRRRCGFLPGLGFGYGAQRRVREFYRVGLGGRFGANHLVCHRLPRPAPPAQRIESEQYRRGPVFGALGNRGGHTQCRQPGRWLNRHIGNTQKGNQHVELYPQAVY